ncbi:MAG: hypothetical protein ABFD18_13215 [Syntrophomonas sp.]
MFFIKKLVYYLMLIACVTIFCGCSSAGEQQAGTFDTTQPNNDFDYTANIYLEDVIDAFSNVGIELIEDLGAGQTLRLNEVTPSVYSVKGTEEIILVYVCPSMGLRTQIYPLSQFEDYQADDDYLNVNFNCKNVLIIYKIPLTTLSHPAPYDNDRRTRLENAAFKLSGAQETVLSGKSSHWDGKVIITHYNNWYRDIDNVTRFENYSREVWKIKYLGPPDEVERVYYSMHSPHGSSRSSAPLNSDGYLQISRRAGSHVFSDEDIYNISLKWNGKKENFIIKSKR